MWSLGGLVSRSVRSAAPTPFLVHDQLQNKETGSIRAQRCQQKQTGPRIEIGVRELRVREHKRIGVLPVPSGRKQSCSETSPFGHNAGTDPAKIRLPSLQNVPKVGGNRQEGSLVCISDAKYDPSDPGHGSAKTRKGHHPEGLGKPLEAPLGKVRRHQC